MIKAYQRPSCPSDTQPPAYKSQTNQTTPAATIPPSAIESAKEWVDFNEK